MVGVMNLPRSNLLVLGSNSIQSLLPATLSAQVEHLLGKHKLQEAAEVADKQKQKLQSQRNVTDNEVHGPLV
jgi:vacuolar protein sorting-associated protein 3